MAKRGNNEGNIRKRPDGRWEGRIRLGIDENGKEIRKSVYGDTREEVVDKLNDLRNQKKFHMPVTSSKETVETFCEHFLLYQLKVKPQSKRVWKALIKTHIYPTLGDKPLHHIKTFDLQRIINRMESEGKDNHTIKMTISFFGRVMKWAKKKFLIPVDPTEDLVMSQTVEKPINFIHPERVEDFLDIPFPQTIKTAVLLGIMTGMRKGEILGLKWSDIDFKRKFLQISRAYVCTSKNGETSDTKNPQSNGMVLLTEDLIDELKEHQEWQKAQGKEYDKLGFVVSTATGLPVFPSSLNKSFSTYVNKHWDSHVRFHDLRHTHATMLANANVGQRVIQERLRWKNPSMASRYIHVTGRMQRNALDSISGMFNRKKPKVK